MRESESVCVRVCESEGERGRERGRDGVVSAPREKAERGGERTVELEGESAWTGVIKRREDALRHARDAEGVKHGVILVKPAGSVSGGDLVSHPPGSNPDAAVQMWVKPRHDAYETQAEGDVTEVGDDVVEGSELDAGRSGWTRE